MDQKVKLLTGLMAMALALGVHEFGRYRLANGRISSPNLRWHPFTGPNSSLTPEELAKAGPNGNGHDSYLELCGMIMKFAERRIERLKRESSDLEDLSRQLAELNTLLQV
jgi:hypothetical protein